LSLIEIIAVIFSFISVIYAVKKSILNWIYGVVGIIFYGILFFQISLYSNLFLQFVFLLQSLHGLWHWKNKNKECRIKKITRIEWILSILLITLLSIIFKYIFKNSVSPNIDSITSSISIVALYLLMKKKIDNWILWVIADILYIYMFFIQGNYLSSLLYFIFLILCIIGYKKWNKKLGYD